MLGVEFMTYGMVLSTLRLLAMVIVAWMLMRMHRSILELPNEPTVKQYFKAIRFELAVIAFISMVALSGSVSPKIVIDTPPNRELQQYQSNTNKEIVIETPEPRTKVLEGFTPLKKE